MKILQLLAFTFLALLIFSCTETDCIEGSRNLSTKIYSELPDFDRIIMNVPGAIVFDVAQSDTAILMTCDDNIEQYIEIAIANGILIIDKNTDNSLCPSRLRFNIYSAAQLKGIEINGAGSFYSDDSLNLDELTLFTNGSGKADFAYLTANKLIFQINGSGEYSAAGTAKSAAYIIEGSGKIDMQNTETNYCTAKIYGDGIIQVWANDTLNAEIYGSGKISYIGDPVLYSKIEGSGVIQKK